MGLTYQELLEQNEKLQKALTEAQSENRIGFTGKPLTVLPNGDLWRGAKLETLPDPEIEVGIDPAPEMKENGAKPSNDPMEKAMENIRATATKRGIITQLTCTWCGHQTEGSNREKNMKYHLDKYHTQALAPGDDKTLLMKSLQDATEQLAAAAQN